LVGARNANLGERAATSLRAASFDVTFIELDVTKPRTVAMAADSIRQRYGRLDILVNNAGIAEKGDGPPSLAEPDAVRRVLEVNFFGVLAVTQAMLPLVRSSASGRIVMVSSGLGSLAWNADPAWPFASVKLLGYNGSEALLNMLTVQLAWELRDTPITVNTVNPSYTATDLNENGGTQTVAEGQPRRCVKLLLRTTHPRVGSSRRVASLPGSAVSLRTDISGQTG
jgi:NAD(P)-dependent dehydrogenase (short-subunit alcohol dehydrogenase family)